jgi:hypothetical protein
MLAPGLRKRHRIVEVVPALLVMMLKDMGKLPGVPTPPTGQHFGFRSPMLPEMESVVWAATWGGKHLAANGSFNPVMGLAAYRDIYDFHTASDVRDVVYITGTPRAVVELMRTLEAQASELGRRLIGSFELDNDGMKRMMGRLGGRMTRMLRWEYGCLD